MKKKIVYLLIALIQCNANLATQLIQGDVKPTVAETGCPTNVTTSFNHPVNATAYDRANGIFWVGLTQGILDFEANEYAVSSFQRTLDSSQIPRFKPHAPTTEGILNNQRVALLTLATGAGDTCSKVAGVKESPLAPMLNGEKKVFLVTLQDKASESATLNDFNPTLNEKGDTTSGIRAIAANRCFIFAAVTPNDSAIFGDENSGIAVVAIDQTTLALNQTAAVPGDSGIKAQQLDNLSPFIRIGGDNDHHPVITGDKAILVWDDQLKRLYAGVSLQSCPDDINLCGTSTQLMGDGLRSIVLAQATCCPEKGELPLFYFAPASAFGNDQDNLVGVTLAVNGEDLSLTVSSLAVMHASTGPSYLILHGGNGTATNQIFALPLVDKCDPSNDDQGKLADKNQFNVTTHRFEEPAAVNMDLTDKDTDVFAQVGAGPLPIQIDHTISDMMVVGDAVYVSLQIPQDDNNETGILYSQALFDDVGQIKSWTPWTKRVWPICGFPDSPSNSQVSFFAVDAVTGKVIAVDGSPHTTVRITEWDEGCSPCTTNCSLAAVLNRSLSDGAYSVLDLDQSTTGIGESIAQRYALFGGTNKVDFALISSSRAPSFPFNINPNPMIKTPYPQRVTIDYCCPDFFKETCLPNGAGCVTSLEYARRVEGQVNTNYFFAGTENGLFAFTNQDGTGFTVNSTNLGLLNQGVIQNGSWQKIPIISGSVVDIKTSGNALYVLTFETSCETPLSSKVQRIPFKDNLTAMFNPNDNIFTIAQSGPTSTSTALQSTLLFTAIDIIQTTGDGSEEQLVLATNNGIFQSKAIGGIQATTTELQANWTNLQCNTLFYGIGSVDNARIKSTDWPFSAQDPCGCKTFERSCIHQLNAKCETVSDFKFVPSFFNHIITCSDDACESKCDQVACCCPETTCDTPCDQATTTCSSSCNHNCCVQTNITNSCCSSLKLFEKICYFWSDGGRRFFIIAPTNSKIAGIPCCGKKKCCCCPLEQLRFLEVTPFNTCVWNVCDPLQTVLKDCILRTIPAFYWVRAIGMTGIVLSGTPCGVVALE